jgi:trans-2-enoyl-CoA reductase
MPKRAIHEAYGRACDVLQVREFAAEAPAADEVIVRMEAAALHIADLRTIEGADTFRFPLPRTPGFEGIGHIERVGSAVSRWQVGDRVFPPLGSGTFCEQLRCKAEACLPAPAGDALQLSLLTVNGPTAAVLLEDFANLQRGDWLIQNAANSSCGRYLIRLASLRGIRTVNLVRRAELINELLALGADVVLLDGEDLPTRVAEATRGAPIKLGVDAVSGPATQRIAECLAEDSPLVSYGSMTNQRCEIDFYLMFRQGITLHGLSFVRQFRKRSPEAVKTLYATLAKLMSEGVLVAKIAAVYSLEDIVTACEHAARCGEDREGKVIIQFNQTA